MPSAIDYIAKTPEGEMPTVVPSLNMPTNYIFSSLVCSIDAHVPFSRPLIVISASVSSFLYLNCETAWQDFGGRGLCALLNTVSTVCREGEKTTSRTHGLRTSCRCSITSKT